MTSSSPMVDLPLQSAILRVKGINEVVNRPPPSTTTIKSSIHQILNLLSSPIRRLLLRRTLSICVTTCNSGVESVKRILAALALQQLRQQQRQREQAPRTAATIRIRDQINPSKILPACTGSTRRHKINQEEENEFVEKIKTRSKRYLAAVVAKVA